MPDNVIIQDPVVTVLVGYNSVDVTLSDDTITVVIPTGTQGEVGPAGPEGGSAVTYPAGENLSTGRVVILEGGEAFYFQPADPAHASRAYGVTLSSALIGANVSVQLSGVVQDAAFGFTEDRILWVGNDGEIQDTQPTGNRLIQTAGIAAENKKMKIDFSTRILKNT